MAVRSKQLFGGVRTTNSLEKTQVSKEGRVRCPVPENLAGNQILYLSHRDLRRRKQATKIPEEETGARNDKASSPKK